MDISNECFDDIASSTYATNNQAKESLYKATDKALSVSNKYTKEQDNNSSRRLFIQSSSTFSTQSYLWPKTTSPQRSRSDNSNVPYLFRSANKDKKSKAKSLLHIRGYTKLEE